MNISDESVEALARVLANEALLDADMAGAGWNAETDSSDHFMPRARVRAKGYLAAAAPHLMVGGCDREGSVLLDNLDFLPTCQACGEVLIHDYYCGELAYRHKSAEGDE